MKVKFEAYEKESEKYYSDMLDKFKQQTKDVITKKELELEKIKQQLQDGQGKVDRIKQRVALKSFKGVISDAEESSEEEKPVVKLDMVEYNFLKADRNKLKGVIIRWVNNFKETKGRDPKDEDTEPIAVEIEDYHKAE